MFPEPEVWKPERWLNAGEEKEREMLRWFWTFGSGGRMCIGRHFAVQGTVPIFIISPKKKIFLGCSAEELICVRFIIEMKLIITAIYTNFSTHIVDDTGIEQEDAYTAGPKGNKLMLRFERAE